MARTQIDRLGSPFANWAAHLQIGEHLPNLQTGQAHLQIGQIDRLGGTYIGHAKNMCVPCFPTDPCSNLHTYTSRNNGFYDSLVEIVLVIVKTCAFYGGSCSAVGQAWSRLSMADGSPTPRFTFVTLF